MQSAGIFLSSYFSLLKFCSSVAALDALASFAKVTHPESAPPGCAFSRPIFVPDTCDGGLFNTPSKESPPLQFHDVWSPQLLASSCTWTAPSSASTQPIQPNTVLLGCAQQDACDASTSNEMDERDDRVTDAPSKKSGTLILTGANTGGKTTLLRSICIATIMAHIGCHVPASRAVLSPVDRIFTRIGAQDRLAAGESTFHVEMTETSAILRHAQHTSLIFLDELGRGTSTHDGEAIATAVLRWLTQRIGCRVLFATHYHDITWDKDILGEDGAGVQVGYMETSLMTSPSTDERRLVSRYTFREGRAEHGSSCGVEVAAMVGIAEVVVERASEIRMERMKKRQRDMMYDCAGAVGGCISGGDHDGLIERKGYDYDVARHVVNSCSNGEEGAEEKLRVELVQALGEMVHGKECHQGSDGYQRELFMEMQRKIVMVLGNES